MIFEAREVHERVTRYPGGGGNDRIRRERLAEISLQRQRAHIRMLVEIGIRVERDDLESCPRRRLRRCTGRHSDNQYLHVELQTGLSTRIRKREPGIWNCA